MMLNNILKSLMFLAVVALPLSGCYNPDLNEFPFVCGGEPGKGVCPDGYTCYGGHCLEEAPECWQSPYFTVQSGGKDDADMEPNNTPPQALLLPCGDINYETTCPSKYTDPNDDQAQPKSLPKAAVCPPGDYDLYKFWLQQCDTIKVTLKLAVDPHTQMGRNLDMALLQETVDQDGNPKYLKVQESVSLNQEESIRFTAPAPGWYYLKVFGHDASPDTGDINGYSLEYYFYEGDVNEQGQCTTQISQ